MSQKKDAKKAKKGFTFVGKKVIMLKDAHEKHRQKTSNERRKKPLTGALSCATLQSHTETTNN